MAKSNNDDITNRSDFEKSPLDALILPIIILKIKGNNL